MNIFFKKVYKFNWDKNRPEEIIVDPKANDFIDYISELIEFVLDDDRRKRYLFPDFTTATKTSINDILNGDKEAAAVSFAKRLLKIEMGVQDRIEHLDREVQKGIMIQTLVERNDKRYFLIIKAEHADFINETDNKKATGLPIKKKIFKAFSAQINAKDKLKYGYVSDYRTSISTYWWSSFLELQEEYTAEYNTAAAFNAIEKKVLNKIKEDYRSDYMYLRNATVQYFRSQEEFVLTDYVNHLFKKYTPEDPMLDVEDLTKKIQALPEKEDFESRFDIIKDKIKKRMIKKVALSDQLELVLKEDIDWGKTIMAEKINGAKFIRIRTNEGYDHFYKK